MKKLSLKILLLTLLVWLSSLIIRSPIGYYWPNSVLTKKMVLLNEKADQYNTIFVGTSRILRGVNPIIFDRNTQQYNNKSFNFAIAGSTAGEIFGLLNQFEKNKPNKLKYIIAELRSFNSSINDKVVDENLHTQRSKYWVDWAGYSFVLSNIWGLNPYEYSFFKRLGLTKKFTYSFLENQFNIGSVDRFFTYFKIKNKEQKTNNYTKVGYYPIDKEHKTDLKKRRKAFLANQESIIKDKKAASKSRPKQAILYNKAYAENLNELVQNFDNQGVKLIFVLPPHLSEGLYKELRPIYNQLPKGHKISLMSSRDYPQLYDPKYMFDKSHFNHKGASVYSELLAKAFTEIVPKSKTSTSKFKEKKVMSKKQWKKLKQREKEKKKK